MTLYRRPGLPLVAVALLSFAIVSCDSDDEVADTDLAKFVGNWTVPADGVSDEAGPVPLTNFSSLTAVFTETTATIAATSVDPSTVPDVNLSGNFSVNEAAATPTLTILLAFSETFTFPLTMPYAFQNNDEQVTLTIPGLAAGQLAAQFGTEFTGDVQLRLERDS